MYIYENEKANIFTETGQVMFVKVRDNVKRLLSASGAVRMQEALSGVGMGWSSLACVDRMVELGELVEVTDKGVYGQHRVFVAA